MFFVATTTHDADKISRVYSMNYEGTDITEVCELEFQEKNESFDNILVDEEENIVLFSVIYDDKTRTHKGFLTKIDQSGTIIDRSNIIDKCDYGQDTFLLGLYIDDHERVIAVFDQGVYILSSEFDKLFEIKDKDNLIVGSAKTIDGKIVCGMSSEGKSVVKELDIDNEKFGEPIELENQFSACSNLMIDGCGDYDFLYISDTDLFGYSIKDKTDTKIIDFALSDINSERIEKIASINSETMLGCLYNDDGKVLTLYMKGDDAQLKDKITITVGSFYVNSYVKDAAIKFNKENDKYRIEFKEYFDYDNISNVDEHVTARNDAMMRMKADILAGNTQDIIDLCWLPVNQLVAKGYLEDLTPYFEKDDMVSKDDIVPAVEKAMEIDGKLYYISPDFSVSALLASKKDVGDKTGWTFDEFKALLDEKGEDVRPFQIENKKYTLHNLVECRIDDYIDWDTGKCSFDSDDFKSVLEVAGRDKDDDSGYETNLDEVLSSGKVIFAESYDGAAPEVYQVYRQFYGSDITCIGYPCNDRQGSYFKMSGMGIYSKSEVKEGAWEFLRTLMTKEYQTEHDYTEIEGCSPTNKEAFEMYMKAITTTEPYTDEFGHEISPRNKTWMLGDLKCNMGPVPEEDAKKYRELIDRTTKVETINDQVMDIVDEEVENYFSGKNSLDEAAGYIQSRVTTYVNENR